MAPARNTGDNEAANEWEGIDSHDFPPAHDFDAEPVLIGEYLWSETVDTVGFKGETRKSTFYCLVTPDGEKTGMWGTAHLDRIMGNTKVGEQLRITFQGRQSLSGGREMRTFSVDRKPRTIKR